MILRPSLLLLVPALAIAANSPFHELFFEPNLGQADHTIRYVARVPGANLAFTDHDLILQLNDHDALPVHLRFPGANPVASFEPLDESPDRSSYFLGNDRTKWIPNVVHYRRLALRNLYPGIDVIFYGSEGHLEYDFVVAPGIDPSSIRMAVDRSATLSLTAAGDLALASFTLKKPVVYQGKHQIDGTYQLTNNRNVRFSLGHYDRAQPLIIDPILTLASYYGGESDDSVVALTSYGDIVGVSSSFTFGAAAGRHGKDIFASYSATSGFNRLLFFGGSGDDVPTCASGDNNTVLIGGWTSSLDFANKPAQGGTDGFLLSIDRRSITGTFAVQLVGGSGDDRINAIYTNGTTYFAGQTNSLDLTLNGQPLLSTLAGGTDAFMGTATAFAALNLSVTSLAYFGGSGDDVANGIVADANGRITIAGRTTSGDLPLKDALFSQLNGPSDAWIARFPRFTSLAPPGLEFSTYLGGSGDDEIRSLALPSTSLGTANISSIYFIGTTSSNDLPLVNPSQPQFGGGDTDAFVGRIDIDPRTLIFNTYLGGSGHDEGNAITPGANSLIGANSLTSAVVVGTTTSPDLHILNPFQDHLAGAQDAFLAWFDPTGASRLLTYFGGSGSERGQTVSVSADNTATIGGDTNSTDLPLPAHNTTPSIYGGNLDGFTASVSLPTFEILSQSSNLYTAKNLSAYASLFVSGDVPKTAILTIASADPSLVQVSLDSSVAGAPSVSVPLAPLSRPVINFYVTGLADAGQTTVTAALDGLPTQQIPVTLGAAVIKFYSSVVANTVFVGDRVNLAAQLGVLDGQGGFNSVYPGPGVTPPALNLTLSDPTLGSLAAPQVASYYGNDQFLATGTGAEVISATSSNLPLLSPSTIAFSIVNPTFSLAGFDLGKNLEKSIFFTWNHSPNFQGLQFAVTSDDPKRLCFVTQNSCAGSTSINPGIQGMLVRALDNSGVVHLTWSNPVFGNGSATVQLTQPQIFANPAPTALSVGSTVDLGPFFGAATDTRFTDDLAAGIDAGLIVTSADPTVASVVVGTPQRILLKGVSAGHTTISVTAPGYISPQPISLNVVPAPGLAASIAKYGSILIGKNLQTSFRLNLATTATVTSSDPSLLLVSTNGTLPGSQQVSGANGFYLQALASSGSVSVKISLPGQADVTIPVLLTPSGYAWGASLFVTNNFSSTSLSANPYALDPVSGLPFAIQSLRPGVTVTPTSSSSNPSIGTLTYQPGLSSFIFSALQPGNTTLTLTQPDGFTAPSAEAVATMVVKSATLSSQVPFFLGRDLETSFVLNQFSNSKQSPVTITSSDPSRLLLSTDASMLGASQLNTMTGSAVYLQSLASSGTVSLQTSSPGFDDIISPVTLTPTAAGLGFTGIYQLPIPLTTLSTNVTASAYLFSNAPITIYTNAPVFLRPGADPIQLSVTTSNPAVAQLSANSVTFNPGSATPNAFTVNPIGPGDATIAIVPPVALHSDIAHEQVPVHVSLPVFADTTIGVARDFETSSSLQFNGPTLPSTIIVTITSNDPSRVLLATRPNQPGQTQISIAFGSNSFQPSYYIQGIAQGQATITASAIGFGDTIFKVNVTQPAFTISGPASAILGQSANVFINFNGLTLRFGAQASINLHSSDSTIATISSPATLASGSSQITATLTALAVGAAIISADLPDGYTGSSPSLSFTVVVSLPPVPVQESLFNFTLGKNLQVVDNVRQTGSASLNLTATSSDPSKVLLSLDPTVAGSASVSSSLPPFTNFPLVIQGLADTGTVTVTLSVPGFKSYTITISLAPSSIVFPSFPLTVLKNSSTSVPIVAVPITAPNSGGQNLRAGLSPVSVVVLSSQPQVGTVKSAIVFNPGDMSASGTFTALAAGTTNLTITQPPGFVSPTTPPVLVVTVN